MGKILIRLRVDLEFLGEEYKESYITFRKIPVKDYQEIVKTLPDEDSTNEEKMGAITIMIDTLKKYFVAGKFPGEDGKLVDLEANDLDDLDSDTATRCFQALVGTPVDPKEPMKSQTTSSTDTETQ